MFTFFSELSLRKVSISPPFFSLFLILLSFSVACRGPDTEESLATISATAVITEVQPTPTDTPTPAPSSTPTAPPTPTETARPTKTAVPPTFSPTPTVELPIQKVGDLCLQWEDLERVRSGMFDSLNMGVDRSLVDWSPTGIYYTFYGAADTAFFSKELVDHPFIPNQTGPDLAVSCSLKKYASQEIAEHAIQLTTMLDFYSVPSSEYCPDNSCLLASMEQQPNIQYRIVPQNVIPGNPVIISYAKYLSGFNFSLMSRYEDVVLRLNIDPWSFEHSEEEFTTLLVELAEWIMSRVVEKYDRLDFPADRPLLQCTLRRGMDGCLAEILAVQLRLQQLGYAHVGTADGIFGQMTQQAVVDFQMRNGLNADSVVGVDTWERLFSDAAVPYNQG